MPHADPRRPRTRPSTRTSLLALLGVLVLLGIALLVAPRGRPVEPVPRTQAVKVPQPSAAEFVPSSAATSGEPAADATALAAPAQRSPMTDREWNAYITEQYPGYRVRQRLAVPSQYGSARLGMNYVLVNERRPEFVLLVSLTQAAADGSLDDLPPAYLTATDGIATSDALFSADAKRHTAYLGSKGQNAIIDAFTRKKPSATAIVAGGFGDEGMLNFTIVEGPHAVARAIKSPEDVDYIATATLPSGPDNAKVTMRVQRW